MLHYLRETQRPIPAAAIAIAAAYYALSKEPK